MKSSYHLPVLLGESINGLKVYPQGVYVDATFGGGGHSYEILKNLSNEGSLISFDQDPDSFNNTFDENNFYFVNENFKHMKRFLKNLGFSKVNGILADLGVSSFQVIRNNIIWYCNYTNSNKRYNCCNDLSCRISKK